MTTVSTPEEGAIDQMSESEDAKRLADLLGQQRCMAEQLARTVDREERTRIQDELKGVRNQCLELVDRYFRQVLYPILLKRFPGKVTGEQRDVSQNAPVGAMVQFTQLLNDFFIQVLSKFDDPFWQKESASELRNYASIAISNNGLIDALRRRKRQKPLSGEDLRKAFEDELASEVEQRFTGTGIDPADGIDLLDRWERATDANQQNSARLLRLFYIAGMKMEQVASDMGLNVKTAYRRKDEALDAVRVELESNV